ncbi:MAG: response regulator [Acidobacteria bacterium]|nr:response regulator [Acidobacteriota bacterium]
MTNSSDTRVESPATDAARRPALSRALLRISASLDLETVLQEVADGACELTGARYGCIVTVDESGTPGDFVTSGLTEEDHHRVAAWPDGLRLFEQLRDLPGPFRIPDFAAFVRSLGVTWDVVLSSACMSTPLRHLGTHVGNFFLGDKKGAAEFTDEDEEVLLLFAAQAAAAIVNARTYRAEQRARADIETLVETSPVGVVVFDARTGHPTSFNREARRMFEVLRVPDHPREHVLEVATCRFGDGREIELDRFPLVETMKRAETLRAEEMVVSTPGGGSLRVLLNATPIHAEDGTVRSLVATAQDLAPLEALDRMRADFLGMVSHELRTPLAAIKGSTTTVLDPAQRFGPAETRQFFRIIDEQADRMSALIGDLLDAGRIDAGTLSVAPEPSALGELVEQARTAFLSGDSRHTVLIDLPADLPRVLADRGRIVQVLNNLLANAARHSPEPTPIRIGAKRDGMHVAVSVSDEGRGIAPERLSHLFRKYPAAGDGERDVGSGLGLAICKGLVEAHGGRIRAESAGPGQGARFTFTVPLAGAAAGGAGASHERRASPDADGQKPCILVVDDDPQMLRYMRDALLGAGYAPLVAADQRELPELLKAERPALVVLDLILPGTDGIELMETVPGLADLPVIFVSAYGRDETIARALEAGAEDYVVKPFSQTELTARIGAALRRRAEPDLFVLGELAIDYAHRRVALGGRPLALTATEYELLRVLSLGAGRVATYDALLRQVWSGRSHANPKLVRAYVQRLRRKLGDDTGQPTYILTERRVGYRMPRPEKA